MSTNVEFVLLMWVPILIAYALILGMEQGPTDWKFLGLFFLLEPVGMSAKIVTVILLTTGS
jgi:hypothetical protein